jgi:type I restriction enzyme S subunit
LKSKEILSEYLAWFINQPSTQSVLEGLMSGSHMKMIHKASFEKVEIKIPSLKIQKEAVESEKLRKKEEMLMKKYVVLKKKLVSDLGMAAVVKDKTGTGE